MTTRTRASWLVYVLGALSAGAIVAAILVVGPASGSQTTVTRTATAAEGVVQSTVSGAGNLQAASQLDLGFKTSGVVSEIYVSQGEHVTEGRLLAELDPKSAEVTLEQSRASLQSAIANLAQVEEDGGETSSSQGSTGSAKTAALAEGAKEPESSSSPSPSSSSPSSSSSQPSSSSQSSPSSRSPSSSSPSSSSTSSSSSSPSSSSQPTESLATREANIASARAAVQSDRLTVQSDEQALAATKLYAPKTGTIVSLTGEVGENVSALGTTRASASASSSSGSGSSGSGTGATGASSSGRSAAGSTGSSNTSGSSGSGSSGSSSSAFAVLSDLSSMQLVVPLSESEIGNVKDGQTATVTVEALDGTKLAAHVSEVATLSTSNSGVVSYDVTFQLDQMASGLKPGMSATAEVVVKQAEGVNVPTSAISGGAVTVLDGGKRERRRVVAGLAGNNSTIVLSGLRAGEKVLLPTVTSTGTSSLTSRLGRALGGGGGGLAGGGGGGVGFAGGGAAFFRGGGG